MTSFIQQMKLLHCVNSRSEAGFTDEERAEARNAVHDNVVDSMVALLQAMEEFDMDFDSAALQDEKFKVILFIK